MLPGSKLSNLAHVLVYSVIGVAFLLFGSNERAPDYMPYLMLAALTAGVGYCALGRHTDRWKLILWLLPGFLAVILLVSWFAVWITPASSVNLGSRFSFTATPMNLSFHDAPPPGVSPFLQLMPVWVIDYWRSHIHYGNVGWVHVPPNTPGATRLNLPFNSPPGWAAVRYTCFISIPIWWPIILLGFPTALWSAIIFILWAIKRLHQTD
jgi:hypothetical protein